MIALSWRDVAYAVALLAALHLAGKVTEGAAALSTGEIALQGGR